MTLPDTAMTIVRCCSIYLSNSSSGDYPSLPLPELLLLSWGVGNGIGIGSGIELGLGITSAIGISYGC